MPVIYNYNIAHAGEITGSADLKVDIKGHIRASRYGASAGATAGRYSRAGKACGVCGDGTVAASGASVINSELNSIVRTGRSPAVKSNTAYAAKVSWRLPVCPDIIIISTAGFGPAVIVKVLSGAARVTAGRDAQMA